MASLLYEQINSSLLSKVTDYDFLCMSDEDVDRIIDETIMPVLSNGIFKNCENHCKLTINKFSNGKKYISGNRCEKGAGIISDNQNLPNLIKYK